MGSAFFPATSPGARSWATPPGIYPPACILHSSRLNMLNSTGFLYGTGAMLASLCCLQVKCKNSPRLVMSPRVAPNFTPCIEITVNNYLYNPICSWVNQCISGKL